MDIGVIIPAYNEEQTIQDVIIDFHNQIPAAKIFVINNNSTDETRLRAEKTLQDIGNQGCVLDEPNQGKANALRRAFVEIDADVYVVVDADLTYAASDVNKLLDPVIQGKADMVVGDRLSQGDYYRENKRLFHGFGNKLVMRLVNTIFRTNQHDIMSGYRVLGRDFIKNCPILIEGFEIEIELTLQAIQRNFRILEVPISYKDRPHGSSSKLNTFDDGFLIIKRILIIFKNYKPLLFFSLFSVLFFISALISGFPVVIEFMRTHYVTHIPLAILATGLMTLSFLSFSVGLILDVTVHMFREVSDILYVRSVQKRLR